MLTVYSLGSFTIAVSALSDVRYVVQEIVDAIFGLVFL